LGSEQVDDLGGGASNPECCGYKQKEAEQAIVFIFRLIELPATPD